MNTTWYPYIELADDPELATQPAGLRMQGFANHGGTTQDRFELYALAAGIVGKCHKCISAHVAEARKAGRTTEQLRDVGRIAATVAGVAAVLDTIAVPA
jgi:alkyl hydroperoxide reductase subunit D